MSVKLTLPLVLLTCVACSVEDAPDENGSGGSGRGTSQAGSSPTLPGSGSSSGGSSGVGMAGSGNPGTAGSVTSGGTAPTTGGNAPTAGTGGSSSAGTASGGTSFVPGGGSGGGAAIPPLDCGKEGWAVENHGPPKNRVNYVILGDGYTAATAETTLKTHIEAAFKRRFGHESGDGVKHHDIDRVGAHEGFADLQGFFTGRRL